MQEIPKEYICSEMLFRYFVRINFKDANLKLSNEEIDEIHKAFAGHLRKICTPEQLDNFVPKNEVEVVLNRDHPLNLNGFHPAFTYHFIDFVEKEKNRLLEEQKKKEEEQEERERNAPSLDANKKLLSVGDKVHPVGRGSEIRYIVEVKGKFVDISGEKGGNAICCVLAEKCVKFKNQ